MVHLFEWTLRLWLLFCCNIFGCHICVLLFIIMPPPVGWGINHWWPSSVCPSVRMSGAWPEIENGRPYSKMKIGRKETIIICQIHESPATPFSGHKVKRLPSGDLGGAQLVCFTRMLMSSKRLVYYSPSWRLLVAVQVTTCRGGGILYRPHYRRHRLLCPAPTVGALSDDARLTSVWRLSVCRVHRA